MKVLLPLMEESRRRIGTLDAVWCDPYIVGFLSMLITLIALRHEGDLESDALALVQQETFAEITGQPADLIGSDIYVLSSTDHPEFLAGCGNATLMYEALFDGTNPAAFEPEDRWGATLRNHDDPPGRGFDLHRRELWREHFEDHLVVR